MNMNVLAKIKKFFSAAIKKGGHVERYPTFKTFLADYNQLIAASNKAEYNRLLGIFKIPGQHSAAAVAYIEDIWLGP